MQRARRRRATERLFYHRRSAVELTRRSEDHSRKFPREHRSISAVLDHRHRRARNATFSRVQTVGRLIDRRRLTASLLRRRTQPSQAQKHHQYFKEHLMAYRKTALFILTPNERAQVSDLNDLWQVSLVKVDSGVAAGSARRGLGNDRAEWWAMFMTRKQFHGCCADDPLRFTDPHLFAQFKTEFDHVFNQPSSLDFHSESGGEPCVSGLRPRRHHPGSPRGGRAAIAAETDERHGGDRGNR